MLFERAFATETATFSRCIPFLKPNLKIAFLCLKIIAMRIISVISKNKFQYGYYSNRK